MGAKLSGNRVVRFGNLSTISFHVLLLEVINLKYYNHLADRRIPQYDIGHENDWEENE